MLRVAVGLVVAAVVGTATAGTSTGAGTSSSCAATSRGELMTIIHRVYDQALNGQQEVSAVRRVRSSSALASAVASGRPAAVRAALRPLMKNQIERIRISKGNTMLAGLGQEPAYGPVSGSIRLHGRVVGKFVLTVATDAAFVAEIQNLSGATIRFGQGGRAGQSFPATKFPSGQTAVVVSLPTPPSSVCGATASDTQLKTVAFVARKVMTSESHSGAVTKTLQYVEGSAPFVSAVASGDPAAVKAAIDNFFRNSQFHIVRVRAWKGNQLVNDVGGPFVLSPAAGVLRDSSGAVVGHFLVAVQDDLGFIKLVHGFTGADVVLHTTAGTVPGGTLIPGPAFKPGLTTTTFNGRRYRSFGFTGTTFPTGTLQVSVLEPQ